jgi:glycerol-3-phosphate acyltransferase PlsY
VLGPLVYLLLTYMLASIPTGPILATLYADTDVTAHGSGNIGATNVNRVLGRRFAVPTLAGDLLKGLLPVAAAPWVLDNAWFPGLVGLVAFSGHCWSAYLSFRGGKGVATAAGVIFALTPLAALLVATAWGATVMFTKRASLGALVGAVALPSVVGGLHPDLLWVALLLGLGVLLRHRSNLSRLIAGLEP